MTKIVAALLLVWEPLNVAIEALNVFSSLAHRGWVPAIELLAHMAIAAVSAAAGVALWNTGREARQLAFAAIALSLVRTVQSVYWSTLPRNTVPGDEALIVLSAMALALAAIATLMRPGRHSTSGRTHVRTF